MTFSCIFFLAAAISTLAVDPNLGPIQNCIRTCAKYTYFCPVKAETDYCGCPTTDSAVTDTMEKARNLVFGCGKMSKAVAGLTVKDVLSCVTQCFGEGGTGDISYCHHPTDNSCTCPKGTIAAAQKEIDNNGYFCGVLTCKAGCQATADTNKYFCRTNSKETCACVANYADAKTKITGDDHYLSCETTSLSHTAVPEDIANDCAKKQQKKGESYYCVKTAADCQGFADFNSFIENLLNNGYACGSVANSAVVTTTTTTTKAPDPIQHCAGFCPPPAKYFCAVDRTSNECPCPYNGDSLTKMLKGSLSNTFGCALKGVMPDTVTVEPVGTCINNCFKKSGTGNTSYCFDPPTTLCTCPKNIDETQKGIDAKKFCGMLTCQVGCRVGGDNYFCEKDSSGTCTGAAAFTDAKALITGNDHYFSCELADESHVAIPHDARVRCATSEKKAGNNFYCVNIADDCQGYADDTQIQAKLDDDYACGSVLAQIVCQGYCRDEKAAYFCTKEDGTCECETDDAAVETALFTNHRDSCQATDASVAVITFDHLEECEKTATAAGQTGKCCGCGPTYMPFCAPCDDIQNTLTDTLKSGAAVGYFANP